MPGGRNCAAPPSRARKGGLNLVRGQVRECVYRRELDAETLVCTRVTRLVRGSRRQTRYVQIQGGAGDQDRAALVLRLGQLGCLAGVDFGNELLGLILRSHKRDRADAQRLNCYRGAKFTTFGLGRLTLEILVLNFPLVRRRRWRSRRFMSEYVISSAEHLFAW